MQRLRALPLDGSPGAVRELADALRAALDGGPAVLPLDAGHPRTPELAAAMRPDEPVEPGTAVIVATSGSTGAPKGVLLSAAALLASARATHARLGGPGSWLLATPAQYVGGLQVLVRALLAGREPVLLDATAGFAPDGFARAAGETFRLPGPHYTALVPTQLARLLDAGGDAVRAAAGFAAIVLGGAALPDAVRTRAVAAGIRLVPAYGMSETASGCVYDGVPLDGVRVSLTGGEVALAGPMLAHGYRLEPERSAAAFAGGWFRTGDLGRWVEGRLRIVGRADDVINTGGVKVPPVLVERVLAAQPGVAEVCVLGLADPRWGQTVAAAVVPISSTVDAAGLGDIASTVDAGKLDTDALAGAVRAELGGPSVPRRWLRLDALPLTGPGKVDRAAVRALFTR